MGYAMSQQHHFTFKMRKECLGKALQSLKGKFESGNPDNPRTFWTGVSSGRIRDATSLKEALRECRWELSFDEDGNVNGISFEGEKLWDDAQMFDSIAPWVEGGSYVEMMGEDGERWRWVFGNGEMQEVEPTTSWPDGGL